MNKFFEIKLNQLNYFIHIFRLNIQKWLLQFFLITFYFLFFGFTKVFILVFSKSYFRNYYKSSNEESYWEVAEGYSSSDIDKFERQV